MSHPESRESLPQTNAEMERLIRIDRLINAYFPDDVEFIMAQLKDEEDVINFLYGQLLEIGEDSDEVLIHYGIIEQ
jgi:hypothetical protein